MHFNDNFAQLLAAAANSNNTNHHHLSGAAGGTAAIAGATSNGVNLSASEKSNTKNNSKVSYRFYLRIAYIAGISMRLKDPEEIQEILEDKPGWVRFEDKQP